MYEIDNGIRKPSVEFKAMSIRSILFTVNQVVNIKYLVEDVGTKGSDNSDLDNIYID